MGRKSKKDDNKKKKKSLAPVKSGYSIKKKTVRKRTNLNRSIQFLPGQNNTPIPIVNMSTRTINAYWPIFCNLFRQRTASGGLSLFTAPVIHSVVMIHDPVTGNLTFDETEKVASCYNRPELPDGDFLCYMINVINYIPDVNHFVAAVKYNTKLYFFNSWGSARGPKFKILDTKVVKYLKDYIDVIYPQFPIRSSIQYNGPALQAASGRIGVNVPVRLNVNGKSVIAPSGFCGLVSLDFIVLMRLLQSRGITLTNPNSFNTYVSQLGSIGLIAGGRETSTPASFLTNGNARPIARLNHAARYSRGLSYQIGRPGNVTLNPFNYRSLTNNIPSLPDRNVRKYTLFYEPRNQSGGAGYNRVTNNFSTKVALVNFLRNYKNIRINLTNYTISKSNNTANRKRITNAGGSSTGPTTYRIPFQNLYMNVNNSIV
ncbi:hypothetical protein N9C10_03550 [Flavobacteriaceae bacterium]|nr:hypothetical protein [Flavobacteriaceae bacterium]